MTLDYRYVNDQMEADTYLLPNVKTLLCDLGSNVAFSVIDLFWGFWNLRLDPDSYQYTAFAVPDRGVYCWRVLPFGLKVAPTEFQRAMEHIFQPEIVANRMRIFVDDIVLLARSLALHIKALDAVLSRLIKYGLYIRLSKLKLCQASAVILGPKVSPGCFTPDPKKVQGLLAAQPPSNKKVLAAFLGAAGYLRDFIPQYAAVSQPLSDLLRKSVAYEWGKPQQEAFVALKQALMEECMLVIPDFTRPFVICCDASECALGAVLLQSDRDGKSVTDMRPICYASKKLSDTERRWSSNEKEAYALVWAAETFDMYIRGRRTTVWTDHKNLLWLQACDKGKIQRWALRLQEYDLDIQHMSGEENFCADWLSRSAGEDPSPELPAETLTPLCLAVLAERPVLHLPTNEEFKRLAKEEPPAMQALFEWRNGLPWSARYQKVFVPTPLRQQLIFWFHSSRYGGHQGVRRTCRRLQRQFWWPKMSNDVAAYVAACPLCHASKSFPRAPGLPHALDRAAPFRLVSIDWVGPRKWFNRRVHILILMDHFSRFVVTKVTTTENADDVLALMNQVWVPLFGAPEVVLADQGCLARSTAFRTYVTHQLCARFALCSAEYPRGNGMNESCHRLIETAIQLFPAVQPFPAFEELVADATLLHNATPNATTGESPGFLLYGVDPVLPGLAPFISAPDEDLRQQLVRHQRLHRLMQEKLRAWRPPTEDGGDTAGEQYRIGDVVTYRLTLAQQRQHPHYSGERSYAAVRSFPQRVVAVGPGSLTVVPLFKKATEPRIVPRTECRLFSRPVSTELLQQAQALFPSTAWLQEPSTEDSTPVPVSESAAASSTGTADVPDSSALLDELLSLLPEEREEDPTTPQALTPRRRRHSRSTPPPKSARAPSRSEEGNDV